MSQLLIIIFIFCGPCCSEVIVQTLSGPVRGNHVKEGKVNAFLGIPYAEPPLGDMRFEKALPKKPWSETYNATKLPSPCVQFYFGDHPFVPDLTNMSEDCLFLNIWSPNSAPTLVPVIVFIHGGGLFSGGINMPAYDGGNLAEFGQVVVCTIQYRLGALGFFTSLTDDAKGNFGFHDQLQAIQWVKENAEAFGGDPNNVVLMGESAGAHAVSLHLISPSSEQLFNKAIILSGSTVHPLFSEDNKMLLTTSETFAKLLGCTDKNETLRSSPSKIVQCLRNISATKIAEAENIIFRRGLIYLSRTGDEFIPEEPTKAFIKGKAKKVKILIGNNRDEGTIFLTMLFPDMFGVFGREGPERVTKIMAKQFIRIVLKRFEVKEADNYANIYIKSIQNWTSSDYKTNLAEAFGDYTITCPTIFLADLLALMDVSVYYYFYDYRPPSFPFAEWMGVIHASELQYLFGNPMFKDDFTDEEEKLSKRMMKRWATFAETGNPNIPGQIEWPLYNPHYPEYLTIGKEEMQNAYPFNNRCDIWREHFGTSIDKVIIQKFELLARALSRDDDAE